MSEEELIRNLINIIEISTDSGEPVGIKGWSAEDGVIQEAYRYLSDHNFAFIDGEWVKA